MLVQDEINDPNIMKYSLEDTKRLFDKVETWNKEHRNTKRPEIQYQFEVPILQDVYGLTELDYSLGISQHVQDKKYYYRIDKAKVENTRAL